MCGRQADGRLGGAEGQLLFQLEQGHVAPVGERVERRVRRVAADAHERAERQVGDVVTTDRHRQLSERRQEDAVGR